jgi:hypothetical protein
MFYNPFVYQWVKNTRDQWKEHVRNENGIKCKSQDFNGGGEIDTATVKRYESK